MIRYLIEIKSSATPVYLQDSKKIQTDRRTKCFMNFTTDVDRAWRFVSLEHASEHLTKINQPWLEVTEHEWVEDVPEQTTIKTEVCSHDHVNQWNDQQNRREVQKCTTCGMVRKGIGITQGQGSYNFGPWEWDSVL